MERRNRRDRSRGVETGPKEFDDITIAVDRVSRTVAGGRRMRFKALVAIGNHKDRIGVGVAKGNDVTTAVAKATAKAKKSMIKFNLDGETICHETRTRATGADVLMKPAAPGTGIIAGGTVRAIIGLTGVKNLISKSLGSANKVNVAYAVIEGLRAQVPRREWTGHEGKAEKVVEKKTTTKKVAEKKSSGEKVASEKKAAPAKKTATKKAASPKKEDK
ncbi:30S ribosomal protein S5 [Candidatus Saccharibacteria bacterium]|nr:30S ribosomal protein S5 [Candidatus Saccharibacteria bacterium]